MYKPWKTAAGSIVLLATLMVASTTYGQSYLGQACWLIQRDDGPVSGSSYIKLAFLDIGDGHLTVNGHSITIELGSPDELDPMNGSAEIFGDQIRMTLNSTSSGADDAAVASFHVEVSAENLAGTFEGYGTFVDKQTEETTPFVFTGTVSLAACPTIWIPQSN